MSERNIEQEQLRVKENTNNSALVELFQSAVYIYEIFKKERTKIVFTTLIFASFSILYALNIPNVYRSEATLISNSVDPSEGGQVSALASIAGIDSGNSRVDDSTLALAMFESRDFVKSLLKKHNLSLPLITLAGWDAKDNTDIYSSAYDFNKEIWLEDKPTDGEIYQKFIGLAKFTKVPDKPIYLLSVESLSPNFAKLLANKIVEEINDSVRILRSEEASKNIKYLENQLLKSSSKDMKETLHSLIFEQTKELMMAEVRSEFVFKVIDSPLAPEKKFYPTRSLICIIITLFGFFLAISYFLVKHFYNEGLKQTNDPVT